MKKLLSCTIAVLCAVMLAGCAASSARYTNFDGQSQDVDTKYDWVDWKWGIKIPLAKETVVTDSDRYGDHKTVKIPWSGEKTK